MNQEAWAKHILELAGKNLSIGWAIIYAYKYIYIYIYIYAFIVYKNNTIDICIYIKVLSFCVFFGL